MTRPCWVHRWARALVRASLPEGDRDPLTSELDDVHAERDARGGRLRADLWYLRQALGFVVRVWLPRWIGRGDGLRGSLSRFAVVLRRLRRRPGYAFAFVATLAVGVGGLCTVYTAANWVLLRPVPGVADQASLVTLRNGTNVGPPQASWDVSHLDLSRLRDRVTTVSGLAGYTPVEVHVQSGGTPRRSTGEIVTSDYFDLLGVRMLAGRSFSPGLADAREDIVIVGHGLARRLAPEDARGAVGRTITVNGRTVEIVGVAPPGFRGAELPGRAELWFPLAALPIVRPSAPASAASDGNAGLWQKMVGRLLPGATLEQTAAAAAAALESIRAEEGGHTFRALHQEIQVSAGIGLDPGIRDAVARTLGLLSAAGALLLALAVANLVNLTLARAASARSAQAVHAALGASRRRLVGGVVAESMVLGVAGAAAALILSWGWSVWFADVQLDERGASLAGITPDLRVIGLTIAAALLASVLAGLPAALSAGRVRVFDPLRGGRHGDRSGNRLRSGLVAGQVALSTVLLVGAGLLVQSVLNRRAVDPGFAIEGLVTFVIDPDVQGYEQDGARELALRLEDRLRADPAVRHAGLVAPFLLNSSYVTGAWYVPGSDPGEDAIIGAEYHVTPGLLAALGARLLAGELPARGSPDGIVVNGTMAGAFFPDAPATTASGRTLATPRDEALELRVAAVVDDLDLYGAARDMPSQGFRDLSAWSGRGSLTGVVRAAGSEAAAVRAVRSAVAAEAPDLPVFDVRTAEQARDLIHAEVGVAARVAGALGLVGLLLAAVGLYGVLACAVAERTREIGVRAALGATPRGLVGRIVGSGLALASAGAVAGIGAALLGGRFVEAYLYGLGPRDPATLGGAVALLVTVACAACLAPALRATRVSPVEVLKAE